MTREQLHKVVIDALGSVAPELDLDSIDPTKDLREQCDLDSVDFFNFIVAVHATTGIDIPEVDYTKVASLDALIAYLQAKAGAG